MSVMRDLFQRDATGGTGGGAGAVRETRCKLNVSDYFRFVILGHAVLML